MQQIESKEEIKLKGQLSPERADAFALTFSADNSTAITEARCCFGLSLLSDMSQELSEG